MAEAALGEVMTKALGLSSLVSAIVRVNVTLAAKVHIVRTLLSIEAVMPLDYKEKADKMLEGYSNYTWARNMMAHNFFRAKGDAVEFHVVQAKGKISIPERSWSVEDFDAANDTLMGYTKEFSALARKITRLPSAKEEEIKDFLSPLLTTLGHPLPMGELAGLASFGPLYPLPQSSHDSGSSPAKREKGAQMCAATRRKQKALKYVKLSSAQKRALREKGEPP